MRVIRERELKHHTVYPLLLEPLPRGQDGRIRRARAQQPRPKETMTSSLYSYCPGEMPQEQKGIAPCPLCSCAYPCLDGILGTLCICQSWEVS